MLCITQIYFLFAPCYVIVVMMCFTQIYDIINFLLPMCFVRLIASATAAVS